MIDDLLSTGGSVLTAAAAVQAEGVEVLGVVGIFNYELAALQENFAERNLTYQTLTNYSELLEAANAERTFTEAEMASMLEWKKDPTAWK